MGRETLGTSDVAGDNVAGEWSVSVALDEEVPLHAIADAKWQSLAETRHATNTYLQSASTLIDGLWGGTLDSDERQLILDELGEPPEYCLPIYLVSVGSGDEERIVYVGKTRSSKRFLYVEDVDVPVEDGFVATRSCSPFSCQILSGHER